MSENNGIQVVVDGQIEYSLNAVIVTAQRPPNFDFSQYLAFNRMGRFKDYWDYLAGLGRGFLGLPNLPGDEFIDKSNAFKYGYYRGNWAMPWALEAAGLKGNPSSTSSAFAIGYNGTLAQTATADAWKLWLTGSALTNSSQYNASQNSTSNGTKTNQESSNSAQFESNISKLPVGERVAAVKTKVAEVAEKNGWVKDRIYSKMNNRDVYKDPKTGDLYSVDSQHGRFEKCNSKGMHQGEVNIDLVQTKPADLSGGHDLSVK